MVRQTVLNQIEVNELEEVDEFDDEISVNEVDEFSDAFSEFGGEIEVNECGGEISVNYVTLDEQIEENQDWFIDTDEDFDDYVRIFDRETYEESNKPNENYVIEIVEMNE
ncbi:MAG: hypothetical protein EZS28_002592 [Streblomastix strix]|uniref:Uncharacterized protein n=1 Tax=Streblomastix strix TaxID=222440 RepID=A0A5J4X3S6_9EUKA|nr:MAG: hypothetical protein EZS28_002592 [Streblomastix strix]